MIRWFAILSLLQLVAFWKILGRIGFSAVARDHGLQCRSSTSCCSTTSR